jgi:hypothetical protein
MKTHHAASLVWMLAYLVSLECTPPSLAQDEPKVPLISMTGQQLRSLGIALRSAGVQPLPNSCAPAGSTGLSVSNEMLTAFRARGFTIESLCLGLASDFHFDPDSGKPMPFASLPESLVPLNLPNCFRRAVPFLDCNWSWEHFWGVKNDERERASLRGVGQTIDAIARNHINSKGYTGTFSPYGTYNKPGNIFRQAESSSRSISIMLKLAMFSKALPLGYGYAFQHPEGDDPEGETVDLTTHAKRSGAVPIWSK